MDFESVHSSILEASENIAPYIYHTPLEHSVYFSTKTGCNVYLKLESQQKTGSFKIRGAFNKLVMSQKTSKNNAEYVTASTGNHGLGCALALTTLRKKGVVYVPLTISSAKENSLKMYRVEIRKFGEDCVETEIEARRSAKEEKKEYISPYADMQIIYGQGTIGKEIADDLPEIDVVFVTVGGGGLISGIGSYFKVHKKNVQIVGCQPKNSLVMMESIKAGHIVDIPSVETLSDASAGGIEQGSPTFPLCQQVVDRWVAVSEDEIADAMYLMLDNHHKVIEGSAGVAVAAFLKHSNEYVGKNIAIVICGCNIAMDKLKFVLKQADTK